MRFLFGIISTALIFVLAGQAHAGLNICNKANVQHSFAVAYKSGGNYKSVGWWNIDPGQCKIVVGGDLKQRYYYYRAIATGRKSEGGKYEFCTTQASFDISGDSDCAARGFEASMFKKLDTGKSAKEYTLNLVEASQPDQTASQTPLTSQPGKYGEPYSDNVIFQECSSTDGPRYCAFHSRGTKFFIYDDGRTPQFVFTVLEAFNPGTPLTVEGDLTGVFDSTAEVVLRDVIVRAYSDNDAVLNDMQGYWYAVDDPADQFNILGAERIDYYDGNPGGSDYLSVQNHCDNFQEGFFLYAREPESGEHYCYEVIEANEFKLVLMYLPRGNFLEYRKLN